jgi:hypothetical protein
MELCAFCNATAGRRTFSQFAAICLLAMHTLLYRLSLAPGDGPNWIKENAARLCVLVAASAAAVTVASAIICGLKFSRRVRALWLTAAVTTVALNILSDMGGSVERHGQYNAIVFAVVVAGPLAFTCVFVTLSRCFCLSVIRTFLAICLLTFVAAWMYWSRVAKGREEWPLGLWNERIVGTPNCPMSWVSEVPSFIDGFPARMLNFWAGSLHCPGGVVVAKWEQDGMLTFIDKCRDGGGSVLVLPPNVTGLPLPLRGDQSLLQVIVWPFGLGIIALMCAVFFAEL